MRFGKGRVLLFVIVISLFLITAGCSHSGRISLPHNIDRISFYQQGGSLSTVSYTEEAKIKVFVDYLYSLEMASATDPNNVENIVGGGWQIRLYSNGEISGIDISGGKYLQAPDGSWWQLSQEQITELENLLKEQAPDE